MFSSALTWIGPLSLLLAALGVTVRDWRALRWLALASGAIGVGAFLPLLVGLERDPPLGSRLLATWLALCAVAVAAHSLRNQSVARAQRLTPVEEGARRRSFAEISPEDFRALLDASQPRELARGEALYTDAGHASRLYCLVAGELVEHVREGDLRKLRGGALVGEAGWILRAGPDVDAPDLRARVDCVLISWDYEVLDRLVRGRPTMRPGLLAGMAESLANPGEWLDAEGFAAEVPLPVGLDSELRDMAFPSLRDEQFALLLARSQLITPGPGTILDTRRHVALITAGSVRVCRADGHYLDLGVGSLLGELGWAAPERSFKEYIVVKTTTDVQMRRWSYEQLNALRATSPRLYAGVMHGVAFDVAVKLGLPMQKVRVVDDAKALMA